MSSFCSFHHLCGGLGGGGLVRVAGFLIFLFQQSAPPKVGHLHIDKGLVRVTTKLVNDRIQDVLYPGMLDGVVGCKQNKGK